MKQKMKLTKSTKNTHVYGGDDDSFVTSVYVKRTELPTPPPQEITMEISYETNP